mmetsp:Transcript_17004/g.31786  ORF Transcript_17004/g.31786 Transcript_17004/m.31786 type:complete len:499 (+) Transcript_17004:122-1618(+)
MMHQRGPNNEFLKPQRSKPSTFANKGGLNSGSNDGTSIKSPGGTTTTHSTNKKSEKTKATRKAAFYFIMGFFSCLVVVRPASDMFLLADTVLSPTGQHDVSHFLDQTAKEGGVKMPEPYQPILNDDMAKWNGIHIVRSRYQQGQPNLLHLGWARLALFRDFCLANMVKQTTQNFVWFIYTDPELNPELLQEMVRILQPYPNFFLIKSMENVLWKIGQAQNMTQATVYTGNRTLLEHTMAMRDVLPTLETRLDADDALHVRFLETVQTQAAQFFFREGVHWMYWCIEDELQWYWLGPKGATPDQQNYGILESLKNKDFCPTPGLTLGYNVGVDISSIYRRKHSILIERIRKKEEDLCGVGRPGKDCVQIIRDYPFPAMRTRTPTSSSMIMQEYDCDKLRQKAAINDTKFDLLANDFGITKENTHRSVKYLNQHIQDIALDAIRGQGDGLFKVPEDAKKRLEKIVEDLMDEAMGCSGNGGGKNATLQKLDDNAAKQVEQS